MMATVTSPLFSTQSNKMEDSFDAASNRSPHTTSQRKLKRLQSAYTDEQHGESKCKHCGWRYEIQNPSSRQRRRHKKICPKLSSLDSGVTGGSGYGSSDYGGSGGSPVLTVDHEVTDTARIRKKLHFGETEQEKGTDSDMEQKQAERRGADAKLKQGPDVENRGGGAWEERVESSKENERSSHHLPKKDPQDADSPRIASSDAESGSESGVSSATGEHETDPSEEMEFESSDVVESPKREDSLQSDDDMLEEEKKNEGGPQKHQSLAQFEGSSESSHAEGSRIGEGKVVNVADLITMFENAQGSTSNVDSVPLAGYKNRRSRPTAKSSEAGLLSPLRSKDCSNVGEITSAKENLEERQASGSETLLKEERQDSGRELLEYDLQLLLKKQKTHDFICPVCGSQITNRLIVRKKKRKFTSKKGQQLPNLQEITSQSSSDQETNVETITATARSQGSWVQRCFSYLGLFGYGRDEHGD